MTDVMSLNAPADLEPFTAIKSRQRMMWGSGALEADLISLLRSLNTGGPANLVVRGEYLEAVITK